MSVFDSMMAEQKNLIIALPYRVGLYVSMSDQVGGGEAQDKELRALSNIIDGYGRDVFGPDLVQEVMGQTLARKNDWSEWHDEISKVPHECREAMGLLNGYSETKEISAFARRLMEISEAVALAFSEYNQKPGLSAQISTVQAYFRAYIKAQKLKRPMRSYSQFLSVSAQERKALQSLAEALGQHSLI